MSGVIFGGSLIFVRKYVHTDFFITIMKKFYILIISSFYLIIVSSFSPNIFQMYVYYCLEIIFKTIFRRNSIRIRKIQIQISLFKNSK